MKIACRNPIEFVEYMFLFIGWNAYSPVGNSDAYRLFCLAAADCYFGRLFGVLHCIVNQIADDVVEVGAVCKGSVIRDLFPELRVRFYQL